MASPDILSILNSLNPTTAEITQLFSAMSKFPPGLLRGLLQSVDERMLQRLATWANTFITYLNKPDSPVDIVEEAAIPSFNTDFLTLMNNTSYVGTKIRQQDMNDALNAMIKAVKSENYLDGVWVGITLGRMLPF